MTDNRNLIEEARDRVSKLADAVPPTQRARILAGDIEDERMSLIIRLTDALEAVEEAHTPTDEERTQEDRREAARELRDIGHADDEREARLEYVIDAAVPVDEFPSWRFRYSRRIADAVRAAGFRRSEVPEPSAEEAVHRALTEHGHRFSLNAADVRDLGAIIISTIRTAAPEPQGEPSDAALRLAERAWMAAYRQQPRERLRAALRAAAAVTKQGENR